MFYLAKEQDNYYITMENIPGEDLKRLVRQVGQMPLGRTVSIARQICEALVIAHALDIVNRDLKPQNIMVDEERFLGLRKEADSGQPEVGDARKHLGVFVNRTWPETE
jgi:serine/threonine-protein kinase